MADDYEDDEEEGQAQPSRTSAAPEQPQNFFDQYDQAQAPRTQAPQTNYFDQFDKPKAQAPSRNYFDQFDEKKKPEAEGGLMSGLREFAHGVFPAVAAAPGMVIGGALGTAVGGPVGGFVGGLAGGMLTGELGTTVQEEGLKAFGISDAQQRAINAQINPVSTFAGSAASMLPAFGVRGASAATRAVSGLVGAGLEAGQEAYRGEGLEPWRIAGQGVVGAALGAPREYVSRLTGLGAERPGFPNEAPKGPADQQVEKENPAAVQSRGTAREAAPPDTGEPPVTNEPQNKAVLGTGGTESSGDRAGPEDYGKKPVAAEQPAAPAGPVSPAVEAALKAATEPAPEPVPTAPVAPPAAPAAIAQAPTQISPPESTGQIRQTTGQVGQPIPAMPDHRVVAADGRPINVTPRVVEAADLKTSADTGFEAGLQPRQRERAASQAQIRDIAANLDPERLGVSSEADRGAPIIGPDAMVESGNGRVMALRQAYRENGPAAQRYREWLAQQGVDVSQFKEPVLVRSRTTELTPEERASFTAAANQPTTLAMSGPERALTDARRITPQMLDLIRNPADLGAIGNRDFVRAFNNSLPATERGALVDAGGAPSAEGMTRIRNAVLAHAYGDAPVLTRVAESTNDDIRSISNALAAVAPRWAKLRADVASGQVRRDVDLTSQLMEAATRTADMRAKGLKFNDYLAQQDAFDQMSPEVEKFMRIFHDPAGRRAASAQRMTDALSFYADEARKVTAERGLNLGLEPVKPTELQDLAFKRGAADVEGTDLFTGRGPGPRAGGEASGAEAQRPGPAPGRGEVGGRGAGQAKPADTEQPAAQGQRLRPVQQQQQIQPEPAEIPSDPAALRGIARSLRNSGIEGRARQYEAAADAIERQQAQQPRARQPPPPPPRGPPPTTPLGGNPPPGGGGPTPPSGLAQQIGERFPFLGKIKRAYQETFDPGSISDDARKAEANIAQYASARAGERDRIIRESFEHEKYWNAVPDNERLDFMHAIETGQPVKPEHQAAADRIGQLLEKAFNQEKQLGSKSAYRQDYFPHLWKAPPGKPPPSEFFSQSLGPTGFQKERTFDLIQQGLAAGYKLKSTNPELLVRDRLLSGADMRQRMELLNRMRGEGMATKVGSNQNADELIKEGWQKINAPDREQWIIAPDAQPVWKNGVAAQGFWSNPGLLGDAFRGWMGFKSAWIPVRLALSAFHPLHVAHINFATNMARAADQVMEGRFNDALKSMGESVTPWSKLGEDAKKQWLLGPEARTAEGKKYVGWMEEGGFSPQMSEQLKIDAGQKLAEAWRQMNPFGIAYHGLRRGVQYAQAPIFERWIPALKTGAYLNDVAALAARRPELFADGASASEVAQRKVMLSAIAKSMDNRFGEMFYDRLFWNRYARDAGIGSFLSLGWNLGFVREFGGAAAEALTRPGAKYGALKPNETTQAIRDATNKIKFAGIYMGTAALIGGMMTKMFTGENPKDASDFIFPRVGGTNPDGSPRRLTTMFYLREAPMLGKHIQEHGGGFGGTLAGAKDMIYSKMLFEPFMELWNNRSYFGNEIYDTNAPGYKQLMQAGQHVLGSQLSPMSASGAQRALETGGTWTKEVPLSMLGFGPAPAYASRSALDNRIAALYQRFVAPEARPYEDEADTHAKQVARNQILMAKQSKDSGALNAAMKAGRAAGLPPQYMGEIGRVTTTQRMFKRLPQQEQMAVLNQANADELKNLWKYSSGKTKIQWIKEHPRQSAGASP